MADSSCIRRKRETEDCPLKSAETLSLKKAVGDRFTFSNWPQKLPKRDSFFPVKDDLLKRLVQNLIK
jgi:hypothetical protein